MIMTLKTEVFQFLLGAIKSQKAGAVYIDAVWFQFLLGAIKSHSACWSRGPHRVSIPAWCD